ncbi:hypothetical protein UJ101_02271 [Flavobacteriaceae bacterium UJ101]|nr:hypothetical protein UJ101_02271 [Flavobacteriaceae bacterium UJ101]
MKRLFCIVFLLIGIVFTFSQEKTDSITELESVMIIRALPKEHQAYNKSLATLDEYLNGTQNVSMIKRGAYAWEASMNGMTSERINTTIDGMHIYGACTDKMDPVTSYVDISNLEKIDLNSGQGGAQYGHTLGGGINMGLRKGSFNDIGLQSKIDLGYETNGAGKIGGFETNYSTNKFYLNMDGIVRDYEDYKAGNGEKVEYTQFTKYNASTNLGYLLNEKQTLEGLFILDYAKDVGYPALPMDVSKASALIGGITYTYKDISERLKKWETKVYLNSITHVMDDTTRPIETLAMHMDMPGWSDTYGMYSELHVKENKHHITANFNAYYNKSLAEMTMYPVDTNEALMFLETWPDVRTLYTGFFVKDEFNLKDNQSKIILNANIANQSNHIKSNDGLNTLKVFYPTISDSQNRFLISGFAQYKTLNRKINWNTSIGYGERVPSVSEGYGIYLFNSFDGYEYIGNPNLKKEKSLEYTLGLNYSKKKYQIDFETNGFYIKDYILGRTADLLPIMVNSNGVKMYENLDYAYILNTNVKIKYKITSKIDFINSFMYSYANDNNKNPLPLIRPFTWRSILQYSHNRFEVRSDMELAAKQSRYDRDFGEDETPGYVIFNLSGKYRFHLGEYSLKTSLGVENILDKNYSTYSDWNNIPRKGRSFFINISYIIK